MGPGHNVWGKRVLQPSLLWVSVHVSPSGEVFQEEATVPDLDLASVVEGRETTMRKDSLGLPGAWHCDGGCRALLGLG